MLSQQQMGWCWLPPALPEHSQGGGVYRIIKEKWNTSQVFVRKQTALQTLSWHMDSLMHEELESYSICERLLETQLTKQYLQINN